MTDLSSLSDNELKALYAVSAPKGGAASGADLSKMSDDDLVKAYHASEPVSTAADVAKSAGTGLVKGALGLAGTIPDISSIAHSAANKYLFDPLFNAISGPKAGTDADQQPPDINKMFGSQGLERGLEAVTGPLYAPKTTAGEYAQTIGEFAPAIVGGEGSALARAGRQVIAPAVASETAGQLTKGTAAEPYARIAGGVAGGILPTLRRAPEMAAPTVEELKNAARAQYNHPDVRNVQINPDAANFLHLWIRNDLENGMNSGFRAANEPKTFAAIEELSNPDQSLRGQVGAPLSIDDVQSVRKVLGRIADTRDATGNLTSDAVAANRAIGHINTFLENLHQPDLVSGNASRARDILQDAAQNWGAAKRAEQIQTLADNARIQAASTYGGGNINNATRQALRPLLKNGGAKARGFNGQEMGALADAVEGSWLGNTLRQIGKYAPDTGLKGLHHIGAAAATGGASIPASLGALLAKYGGDAMTRRSVNRLDEMLRTRSPLHRQNVAARTSPMLPTSIPGLLMNNPGYVPPSTANRALPTLSNLLASAQSANLR